MPERLLTNGSGKNGLSALIYQSDTTDTNYSEMLVSFRATSVLNDCDSRKVFIIIILYRNLNNIMNRPLPFIFGHRVAWIGKTVKFQYTNDSSFGHVWPRTKGVRLTNFGSPVYNRSSQ